MRTRSIHPSTPLVSGLIAALAFMAGATAFEFGRSTAIADAGTLDVPIDAVAVNAPAMPPRLRRLQTFSLTFGQSWRL
jgi:hypothetical protein